MSLELMGQIVFSHSASCDILTELVLTNFLLLGSNSVYIGIRLRIFRKRLLRHLKGSPRRVYCIQEEYTARPEPRGLPSRRRQ